MIKYICTLLVGLFFLGCNVNEQASLQECFQLPAGTHLPRFAQQDSTFILSFVRSTEQQSELHYALHTFDNKWGILLDRPIHVDSNMFINWADFPSITVYTPDIPNPPPMYKYYWAHWLQYSGKGTYDYDVMGMNFGDRVFFDPVKLHQDTVSAEHGFVSTANLGQSDIQVSWLDGRYTKEVGAAAGAADGETQEEDHGHGHGGAMTLRTKALSDSVSVELDHRVCDCCNTATTATKDLVMVAYRDRSEQEIRDIGYVIKPTGGEWSTPKLVHADNWEISGCPVNGPALAANDAGNIAVIWYTAPADRAQIRFSRYDAANDAFSPPLLLDDNTPLGRVDLQLAEDGTAYATALTTKEDTDDAFLTLWTISPSGEVSREDLATTSAARSAGFPKIALFQNKLYWTRTVLGDKKGDQYAEVCWR
ncbi:MAG: hypothetical protein ACI81P_001321 [Neolewinella sp.]|jgi:hypothetical protein